ncbi:MAG: YgjV family protein [Clostridia bacterium]|nr:YgjV family protein [Clostridia bacterium]
MEGRYLAGQIFGILGLIGTVVCYQFNSRKKILIMQILCTVVFTLNLSLLGAWSGALLNVLGIAKSCVFYQRGRRRWADSVWWIVLFCVLAAVCVAATYQTPIDLVPLIGTVFTTVALAQKDARTIRLLTLPSPPSWFVYNLANGNLGGMANEIFVLSSLLIAVLRFDDLRLRKKPAEGQAAGAGSDENQG